MTKTEQDHSQHNAAPDDMAKYFEAPAWQERYSGSESVWSGRANVQLVVEVASLMPGTALDMGCGEGGDVIWLAQQGWRVTGADFAANGLARAAAHAADAGVGDQVQFWQVDAREFDAGGKKYDLVTTHYLHPPRGGMVAVLGLLAQAVAPGGHLLVVGHAPSTAHPATGEHRKAMFYAADLLPGVPDGFEVLTCVQRPRSVERDGQMIEIDDSVLLVRRA